jgi:hypothetical protein
VSLRQCVAEWNKASLGSGRGLVVGSVGSGRKGLVFRFQDGVCGLTFPPSVSKGVYLTVLHGDYLLLYAPGVGPKTPHPVPSDAVLEARAATQTNVRVTGLGRLVAESKATSPILPYTVIDSRSPCKRVSPPPPISQVPYRIDKATVNCVWVETLLWAYLSQQGSVLQSKTAGSTARLIVGWRCTGTGLLPRGFGGGKTDRRRINCSNGSNVVEARATQAQVIGSG